MARLFFDDGPLASFLQARSDAMNSLVIAVPDREAIARDRGQWIDDLVEATMCEVPALLNDGQPQVEDLGRRVRDVTHLSGITYSLSEWGRIRRDTVNYRVTLQVCGPAAMLLYRPDGGCPIVIGDADGNTISQDFFYVIGHETSEAFESELSEWLRGIEQGVARIAMQISSFNDRLPNEVAKRVDEHLASANSAAAFTASLPFPVSRREDAPPKVRQPAVRAIRREIPRAGELPSAQPTLGRYYDEIISVLESAMRAMERTPGRYRDWNEENLRDALLVQLNMQFKGVAHGEAFNASGKTDILIRAEDENLFIGECKVWHGAAHFDRAISQLLGYTTWRDSRLAIILFVRSREIHAVVDKARTAIQQRPEFDHWLVGAEGRKARIRWVGDPARTATAALLPCHLPLSAPRGQEDA